MSLQCDSYWLNRLLSIFLNDYVHCSLLATCLMTCLYIKICDVCLGEIYLCIKLSLCHFVCAFIGRVLLLGVCFYWVCALLVVCFQLQFSASLLT